LHHFGPYALLRAFETTKKKKLIFLEEYPILLLLHVLVIHSFAIIGILIFGGTWQDMIFTSEGPGQNLLNYGYSLGVVYLVWIGVVLFLYPFCKKYMKYKANNKDKWWLSYL
jgi:magnesium-transporting ATPase (P-type)